VPPAFPAVRHLHAILKGWVSFDEIEDVESYPTSKFEVLNAEKEPLCAASRVNVFVKQQEVLIWLVWFLHVGQIATLKPALEHDLRLLRR
jgi:hypothetical protein